MIRKVISGGQTGVDRAALDVALELRLACGGWCPKGRKAEDGPIARRYPLKETASDDYATRTVRNVRDAEGTLILSRGSLTGGSAQTLQAAAQLRKPYLVMDLAGQPSVSVVHAWLTQRKIKVLNVAGPRESRHPGIYGQAKQFLRQVLAPFFRAPKLRTR